MIFANNSDTRDDKEFNYLKAGDTVLIINRIFGDMALCTVTMIGENLVMVDAPSEFSENAKSYLACGWGRSGWRLVHDTVEARAALYDRFPEKGKDLRPIKLHALMSSGRTR